MILVIEPKKCTGCMACVLYCSLSHEGQVIPELSRIQILADRERKTLVPIACIPCETKACLAACPEPGAITVDARGGVVIVEALCTACNKCGRACQIGAIQIHPLAGRGKKGKAVALKCDQCGGDPWCQKVCPTAAILRVDDSDGSQVIFDRLLAARQTLSEKGLVK